MSELPPITRIVTTHDPQGISTVQHVGQLELESAAEKGFPGVKSSILWATESVPTKDNNNDVDGGTRKVTGGLGLVIPGGVNCIMTDIAPGATATWHRTTSLDHNVLISGKLILLLEDGSEHLIDQPGSVVVQRGTLHAWRNPGPEWARWMAVLIDADPAIVDGKTLDTDARPM